MDMLLRYWPYIEADFARFYRITEPLKLSWRRWKVLFRGLPHDSSFMAAIQEELKLENMSATEKIEYLRRKQEQNISIEQLTEEVRR